MTAPTGRAAPPRLRQPAGLPSADRIRVVEDLNELADRDFVYDSSLMGDDAPYMVDAALRDPDQGVLSLRGAPDGIGGLAFRLSSK